LTEANLATYETIKIFDVLQHLGKAKSDAGSGNAEKAVREAAIDASNIADRNQAKLEDTFKKAAAEAKRKREKMANKVTDLSRQKDDQNIPKEIIKEIEETKKTISRLVDETADSAKDFASASKQLRDGWMEVAKQLLPRASDASAVKALQTASGDVKKAQKAADEAIDEMRNDASMMDALKKQTLGIMDGVKKSARASADLLMRMDEIKEESSKVKLLIKASQELEEKVKNLFKGTGMLDERNSKTASDRVSDLGRNLKKARELLPDVEIPLNNLYKAIALYHPKLMSALVSDGDLYPGKKPLYKILKDQIEKRAKVEKELISEWKKRAFVKPNGSTKGNARG
jgi:hypothetical protein